MMKTGIAIAANEIERKKEYGKPKVRKKIAMPKLHLRILKMGNKKKTVWCCRNSLCCSCMKTVI